MKSKLLILIVMVLMIGVAMTPITQADESWWNQNWNYRLRYTITNGGGVANTIVRVDLNDTLGFVVAHARSDGGDVRFLQNDQSTQLAYWTEYWNVSTEKGGTFWINYPSLPADSTYIWVYYGYSSATSNSNGSAVFSHFDDFDEHTTNRDVYTDSAVGTNMIYEKSSTPEFTPSDSYWTEGDQKMMGITIGTNATDSGYFQMAYGTYINTSYACICGAESSTGSSWTRYTTQPIINHTTVDENYDGIKVTEPDFLHNISLSGEGAWDNYQKEIMADGYDSSYTLFYSALSSLNWSISFAYSTIFDTDWNKIGFPVFNVSVDEWDLSAVRKPVVFKLDDYFWMFYAGSGDGNNSWDIGIAQSTDLVTWTRPYDFAVMNNSAYGWDEHSIIPLDIWFDNSNIGLMYAGMNNTLDWRIGWALFPDDTFLNPTKWGGTITLGDATAWDGLDCNYGTGCVIDEDESTEYYKNYHTGKSATATAMGSAVCRNSTWNHNGTAVSCLSIQNFVDGTTRLRVDTNETYLCKNVYGVVEPDVYDNNSASVDWWARSSMNDNNASVCMRSTGGYATRDHYATHLDVTNDMVELSENVNGADTVLDNDTVTLTTPQDFQHLLNIACVGANLSSFSESMPENTYNNASATDSTLYSGIFALQTYVMSPMDFDFFRIAGFSGVTITTTSGGSEQDYASQSGTGGTGGGGGGLPPVDEFDDTMTEEEDEGWLDGLCGTSWIMIGIAFGGGSIGLFKKVQNIRERRRRSR